MKSEYNRQITRQMMDYAFLDEVIKNPQGKKILDCIQCGVCAGSCHARFAMDYSPMQIIKMVHLGLREPVLTSSTIWICASCYACTTRCPRGIDIPLLMSTLKNMAIKNGAVSDSEIKPRFHRSFTKIVGKYGRMHEPELKMRLLPKTNLRELYQNAVLALRLWRKGKVRLQAPKIDQIDQISEIFDNLLKKGEESK